MVPGMAEPAPGSSADLQEDWEDQVARAYRTIRGSAAPTTVTEFGLGDWLEKLHPRDIAGRFTEKARATLEKGKEKATRAFLPDFSDGGGGGGGVDFFSIPDPTILDIADFWDNMKGHLYIDGQFVPETPFQDWLDDFFHPPVPGGGASNRKKVQKEPKEPKASKEKKPEDGSGKPPENPSKPTKDDAEHLDKSKDSKKSEKPPSKPRGGYVATPGTRYEHKGGYTIEHRTNPDLEAEDKGAHWALIDPDGRTLPVRYPSAQAAEKDAQELGEKWAKGEIKKPTENEKANDPSLQTDAEHQASLEAVKKNHIENHQDGDDPLEALIADILENPGDYDTDQVQQARYAWMNKHMADEIDPEKLTDEFMKDWEEKHPDYDPNNPDHQRGYRLIKNNTLARFENELAAAKATNRENMDMNDLLLDAQAQAKPPPPSTKGITVPTPRNVSQADLKHARYDPKQGDTPVDATEAAIWATAAARPEGGVTPELVQETLDAHKKRREWVGLSDNWFVSNVAFEGTDDGGVEVVHRQQETFATPGGYTISYDDVNMEWALRNPSGDIVGEGWSTAREAETSWKDELSKGDEFPGGAMKPTGEEAQKQAWLEQQEAANPAPTPPKVTDEEQQELYDAGAAIDMPEAKKLAKMLSYPERYSTLEIADAFKALKSKVKLTEAPPGSVDALKKLQKTYNQTMADKQVQRNERAAKTAAEDMAWEAEKQRRAAEAATQPPVPAPTPDAQAQSPTLEDVVEASGSKKYKDVAAKVNDPATTLEELEQVEKDFKEYKDTLGFGTYDKTATYNDTVESVLDAEGSEEAAAAKYGPNWKDDIRQIVEEEAKASEEYIQRQRDAQDAVLQMIDKRKAELQTPAEPEPEETGTEGTEGTPEQEPEGHEGTSEEEGTIPEPETAAPSAEEASAPEEPKWDGKPVQDMTAENIPGFEENPNATQAEKDAREKASEAMKSWRQQVEKMRQMEETYQRLLEIFGHPDTPSLAAWKAKHPEPAKDANDLGPGANGQWNSWAKGYQQAAANLKDLATKRKAFGLRNGKARRNFQQKMDKLAEETGYTGERWWDSF